ncbi:MAG: hypothetical protein QOF60_3347 [Actinomycetota bacterium]|nr:hypothetical protein [Actinomycetota bacterium]
MGERWEGRPLLSAVVLSAAHAVPVGAAVVTSALLSRRVQEPHGWADTLGKWALLFGASTLVLLAVDRVAKRLLPLAALLKLSMLFPDRAPGRLRVAMRSGSVRNLQSRLDEASALGDDDVPANAAATILALVGALHAHDRHTRGHSERVRWFTDLIAEELKLSPGDRDRLRWASLLHDIGKLRVNPRILNKPARLARREWRHIHRHPEAGAALAAPLAPFLGEWWLTIAQHHERYDGSGYPNRLRGDQISLGARIVAVADAYEVMTAVRAYKKAASAPAARRELTASAGSQFDPTIVRAFLNISIGRLRWVTGPVAWVAQIPFVGWVPRLAEGAVAVGGQAAGVVGAAAVLSGGTTFLDSPEPLVIETPTASVPGADGGALPDGGLDPTGAAVRPTRVLGTSVTRLPAPAASTASSSADLPSSVGSILDDVTSGNSSAAPGSGIVDSPGHSEDANKPVATVAEKNLERQAREEARRLRDSITTTTTTTIVAKAKP